MITKAKKVQFTTSDGTEYATLEQGKIHELLFLSGVASEARAEECFAALVKRPREAIAILKFGLPRKPRTVKPPMGKKPRRKTQPVIEDPPRVRTADEIKAASLR